MSLRENEAHGFKRERIQSIRELPMKANDFDKYFDDGGSVMPFADMSKAERPNVKTKRVNVDFPAWMVEASDKEAAYLTAPRV